MQIKTTHIVLVVCLFLFFLGEFMITSNDHYFRQDEPEIVRKYRVRLLRTRYGHDYKFEARNACGDEEAVGCLVVWTSPYSIFVAEILSTDEHDCVVKHFEHRIPYSVNESVRNVKSIGC